MTDTGLVGVNRMYTIMHINCACTGSTGKIICDIADFAATRKIQTLLCAPSTPGRNENIRYFRTSLPYEQGIYRRLNSVYGFQYGFAPLSTVRIKRIIKREKPDVIHIHCINGFMVNIYQLFSFLKKRNIPCIITNHAEFFYTGGCAYAYDCDKWQTGCGQCPQGYLATGCKIKDTSAAAWQKMKKAFENLHGAVMVSVSPWVRDRAAQSPITASIPQKTIWNGVNTQIFTYHDVFELRQKHGIASKMRVVFHPTANFSEATDDRKGGRYILELAQILKDQNVVFIVAGKHTPEMKVPPNVILLGVVSDQNIMAQYYSMADVTVVVGKRETFNMPVAESLCCGTPVVGFMAGGPESIAMKEYSRFVDYGDSDALANNLLWMLTQENDKHTISKQAKKQYAATVMAEEYINIYEQLLKNGSE